MKTYQPIRNFLKFCGFTRESDVEIALDCGVDALGFNFFRNSPRYVSPESAARLAKVAGDQVLKVGIFVDEPVESLAEIVRQVSLDVIQLHGAEDLAYLAKLTEHGIGREYPIWRALSWRGEEHPEDADRALAWQARMNEGLVFLIDAHDHVQKGGTGKKARWDLLCPAPKPLDETPFLLAGGLNPENIPEAIATVRPAGIDLASGIESAPGLKDPARMRAAAEAARGAWKTELS